MLIYESKLCPCAVGNSDDSTNNVSIIFIPIKLPNRKQKKILSSEHITVSYIPYINDGYKYKKMWGLNHNRNLLYPWVTFALIIAIFA